MNLLLHACCGPCSIEPTRIFSEEGIPFELYYANSNIYPEQEYDHRLITLKEYAEARGIMVNEGVYDPSVWERCAAPQGTDRPARCRACYRLRFEETARVAAERGFDAISTTLTISPYQFIETINEELVRAAEPYSLIAVTRDFRDSYREATRISRDIGMYRQNYCGCRMSIGEAEREREQRKEARKREKAEKRRLKEQAALERAEGVHDAD